VTEPFWESAYRDGESDTFGPPSAEIVDLAERLPPGSRVLDVACGEGRNALHLARQGHRVEAFDLSEAGIAKLNGATAGLELRAWVGDMASFAFDGRWDLLVFHGVLHLITRDEWDALLERARAATPPGGVHVVAVFTDRLPPPPDLAPFMKGLFREDEIFQLYADWEVDLARSYTLEDEHPGGIRHRHPINKVVARRPR